MSLNSGLPSTLGKFSGSRLEIVRPTNTSTIPEGTEVDNKFHMDNNDNRLFIVIVTLVKWWKVDDIRLCNGDYDNNYENYDEGGNNSMTIDDSNDDDDDDDEYGDENDDDKTADDDDDDECNNQVESSFLYYRLQNSNNNKGMKFLRKLWCCVCGRVHV